MALDGGFTLEGEAEAARYFWPNATSAPAADAPSATVYFVELTSTAPTDAAAGTELTGDGYGGGLSVNQSDMTYSQAAGATALKNTGQVIGGNPGWGAPTAQWSIEGFNFYDAAAGTRYFWGTPTSTVTAEIGAYVQFASDALVISFT